MCIYQHLHYRDISTSIRTRIQTPWNVFTRFCRNKLVTQKDRLITVTADGTYGLSSLRILGRIFIIESRSDAVHQLDTHTHVYIVIQAVNVQYPLQSSLSCCRSINTRSLDVTSTVNTSHVLVQVAFILTRLRAELTAEDFDVTDAVNDRQVTL